MTQPAGWYPDYTDNTRMRYWDGKRWSEETTERGDGEITAPPVTASGVSAGSPTGEVNDRPMWYRRHWVHLVAALIVGIVIGSAGGGGTSAPKETAEDRAQAAAAEAAAAQVRASAEASEAAAAAAEARASAIAALPPAKAAWRISVKILKKTCFGSAGCNVIYQIVPSFVGPGSPDGLDITYEVLGGEDGPQVNTFTTDEDGTASYDREESLSTATTRVKLTARVTAVDRH